MKIYDPKKSKRPLKRMITFLLAVEFYLIIIAVLVIINFLAFMSGFGWAIFIAIFFDVSLVLIILDIITD